MCGFRIRGKSLEATFEAGLFLNKPTSLKYGIFTVNETCVRSLC